jgi:pyrroloquinoline quinone biosynthesis protein B
VLDEERIVVDNSGELLGLRLRAFAVAGGPPPYAGRREAGRPGDTIGLLITDATTGGSLAYVPSCGAVTAELLDEISGADCVLFDGTVWRDDEIVALGVPGRSGRSMQHLPLAGLDGSLQRLLPLTNRRILTHINNTNPLLREDGAERATAAALGWEVAHDGLEVTL